MLSVALDGPAGAGKSTIAKTLAQKFGFLYVDTGALYRAIGKYMLDHGKHPGDPAQVVPLLSSLSVELCYREDGQRVLVNGEDVTGQIRTQAVSAAASQVSAIKEVRVFLFSLQRELAQKHNVMMDGRDIGTVVLPQATVKIFLTASAEDRARRRYLDLQQKGDDTPYEEVLRTVIQRDYDDSHRSVAPLCQASDALLVDTTGETLETSLQRLEALILEQLEKKGERLP